MFQQNYRSTLRSKLMVSAFSGLCLVSSQALFAPSASAAMVHVALASTHMSLGGKTVKLSVNNAGSETLNILVGDKPMTIEPGKTIAIDAMPGTKITTASETKNHKSGEVLTEVTKDLSGSTLHIG